MCNFFKIFQENTVWLWQSLSCHCKGSEFWYDFSLVLSSNTPPSRHRIPSIYVTPRVKGRISGKQWQPTGVSLSVLAGEWVVINSYNWFSPFSCDCLRHSLLLFFVLGLLRQQRPLWQSSLIRVELIRSVQAASPMDSSSLTPTNPRAGAKRGWPRDTHSPLVDTH